jgi:hypothetical protein
MTKVQKAVDAAVNGDRVEVDPGTYDGTLNFDGKSIEVTAVKGPTKTILDGGGNNSVVIFEKGETTSAVLQGFTVQHGSNLYGGGGIYIGSSSPTIQDDVIQDNEGCTGGAGVYIDEGSPVIQDNVIGDNVGGTAMGCGGYLSGGGIKSQNSDASIVGNFIADNTMDAGSGLATDGGAPLIEDNIVIGNSDDGQGGATGFELDDSQSGTMVIQNLVADNEGTGTDSSAVRIAAVDPITLVSNTIIAESEYYAVWIDDSSSPPNLVNNIVDGAQVPLGCNSTFTVAPYLSHNDVYGASATSGACASLLLSQANLSAAPQFSDPTTLDFTEAPASPTVDAGENSDATVPFTLPSEDLAGDPRIVNGTVDMGAYELQGTSSSSRKEAPGVRCPPQLRWSVRCAS